MLVGEGGQHINERVVERGGEDRVGAVCTAGIDHELDFHFPRRATGATHIRKNKYPKTRLPSNARTGDGCFEIEFNKYLDRSVFLSLARSNVRSLQLRTHA